jgi:GNAT superfamily N-acetyltransferase
VTPLRIEKLQRAHHIDDFDCGQEPLNRFLTRYALTNQQAGSSQTYLAVANDSDIVGFYTLVVGQVGYEDAPARVKKGLARHPVPVMVLARLAIRVGWQGKGLGSGLLKDAMQRTIQAANIAGIRALVVHVKDESAVAFYERFNFLPSPSDPHHLYVLLKAIPGLLR